MLDIIEEIELNDIKYKSLYKAYITSLINEETLQNYMLDFIFIRFMSNLLDIITEETPQNYMLDVLFYFVLFCFVLY
jgi:hypothetical protein